MKYAQVGPIAVHLPERIETNEQLESREFPQWNLDLIYAKTGIRARHIAAPDECASDLGVAAAEKLFAEQTSTAARSTSCCSARRRPTIRCQRPPAWCSIAWDCARRSAPWTSISVARASSTACRWPTA